MNWDKLICDKRLGLEDHHDDKHGVRSDFERDYDRLVFSSPFRRLQNKTQVFPLPGSIFVHNRLTHSLEVSSVGKSLAREIAIRLMPRYQGEPWAYKLRDIGEIVAAACLAHDLGNPPFGHSGEKTIGAYFSEGAGLALRDKFTIGQWNDLTHFEGNANSLRTLVHQFKGRRPGGFAMTYSTLASIVKYPYSSTQAGSNGKFGFFTSEKEVFERIAGELGLVQLGPERYARHPLVYLVEAADDICYQVMDIEDGHKLKIISTEETLELLLAFFDDDRQQHMRQVMTHVADPNEQVGYLRSCTVGLLVQECAKTFVDNEPQIMAGTFTGSLIDHIAPRAAQGYQRCSRLAYDKLYRASYVVDVDLAGNRIINLLLSKLIEAVLHPERNYSQLLLNKFPQQYDVHAPTLFEKIQAVLDHISAMTDVYALNLYRQLNGIALPTV
ncbi:MAG: deoxyguanosinetriphosphate triphosphohydrolase [Muribaculaceae bacterium]|nr:deoxyguanosinetriphosphate triphosphohydrolase [Muribaculaceae bacterium]MBR1474745.1 deoxyguanosinetriphosphate triphosphohydrolase [Muribaculaceae bacterium]MBR1727187.1 deoxyguanosinetriphosphate triphosphohydrolase [Muribaculaceae bacterium]